MPCGLTRGCIRLREYVGALRTAPRILRFVSTVLLVSLFVVIVVPLRGGEGVCWAAGEPPCVLLRRAGRGTRLGVGRRSPRPPAGVARGPPRRARPGARPARRLGAGPEAAPPRRRLVTVLVPPRRRRTRGCIGRAGRRRCAAGRRRLLCSPIRFRGAPVSRHLFCRPPIARHAERARPRVRDNGVRG